MSDTRPDPVKDLCQRRSETFAERASCRSTSGTNSGRCEAQGVRVTAVAPGSSLHRFSDGFPEAMNDRIREGWSKL
jgi:hypothetical protein